MRFRQHLKSIANPENRTTSLGKIANRRHYRGKASDRSTTQCVAIGKPSWQHECVKTGEVRFTIVNQSRRRPDIILNCIEGVVVAVASGKGDDSNHQNLPTLPARQRWRLKIARSLDSQAVALPFESP